MPTTCGAGKFAHFTPKIDAACVSLLRAAGAVIVGKVTTTEFAYFEPSPTRNPWNTGHTPGGSSSGSAAAVGAGMVPVALGSQTIGSVLRPAGYCGVIGYKGSYGAIPMTGSFPLARSLDHIGIFAGNIADTRLVFEILSGRPMEMTTLQPPRIAVPRALVERATPPLAGQISANLDLLRQQGAQIVEVALPASFDSIHEAGRIVLEAEFSSYQEELYVHHAAEYRPRTRGLIDAGLAQRSVSYIRAQNLRQRFREEMRTILQEVDFMVSPTAASTAPKGLDFTGDPWFCAPWSSIGTPALSMPTGLDGEGLPYAIQLIAKHESDANLFAQAEWCERQFNFRARPKL